MLSRPIDSLTSDWIEAKSDSSCTPDAIDFNIALARTNLSTPANEGGLLEASLYGGCPFFAGSFEILLILDAKSLRFF